MNFAALSTTALIASGLAASAAVFVLHLLRRTARAQLVSNVEFWRRAAERTRPRTLLARRIPWLPVLLSLAIALLLVAAMGDPRIGTGFSGTTVIVLDTDRTMATHDQRGRRRLDDAAAIVRETVRRDTISGRVAVVRAGARSEVLVPLTSRAADIERVLARTEADDTTADLTSAVALARSIARNAGGPARIVVLADRDDFARTDDGVVPVTFTHVGTPAETIAIAAFDARRDPNALGEYRVRCEVRSYSAHAARARLVIRDRGTVISEQAVALGPGGSLSHRAHGFSSAQSELTARLEGIQIDGGYDALANDDVAFATVSPTVATRVLLVTSGNRFLEQALAANPSVELESTDAPGLARRRANLARYHVVVLDRTAPSPPLDHPAVLVIGAADGRSLRMGPELRSPLVTAFAADHRVLSGLRFDQVAIAVAHALLPDADDRVLARSGPDALVLARERSGARLLALGFDTDSTDMVQRIVFPLFVHNALVWLDGREREFQSWQRPGEPIRASGERSVVLTPSAEARDALGVFYDTARAGIYHTEDRAIAVSGVEAVGSLITGVEPPASVRTVARGRPSLALVVAGVVLGLLVTDWVLTQRGRLP